MEKKKGGKNETFHKPMYKMKDNLTIYLVRKKKDLDRLMKSLETKGFEFKKCVICGKKIYNYNTKRSQKGIYEKFLSLFGVEFTEWKTNFSSVSNKSKGFVCENMSCFIEDSFKNI